MKRFIPILLSLSLLAGCAVGPDYKRPDLSVPGSYRYEVKDASDTANTEWWRQFDDPALDALIEEALVNNKNVKISAAQVERAAGLLVQTRSPIFPQLNYSGIAERQRVTELGATPLSTSVPNPQTAYQVLGSASWEIDLWGRIRRSTIRSCRSWWSPSSRAPARCGRPVVGVDIALRWLVILPLATPKDIHFPVLHHVMPLVIGIALLWLAR